ncbi:hypothetical protein FJZ48_03225 [Candidatus Uhrbacteria bacterium]|nr:hypothetical protein [Candidatus Uhrbacteria bacterium]
MNEQAPLQVDPRPKRKDPSPVEARPVVPSIERSSRSKIHRGGLVTRLALPIIGAVALWLGAKDKNAPAISEPEESFSEEASSEGAENPRTIPVGELGQGPVTFIDPNSETVEWEDLDEPDGGQAEEVGENDGMTFGELKQRAVLEGFVKSHYPDSRFISVGSGTYEVQLKGEDGSKFRIKIPEDGSGWSIPRVSSLDDDRSISQESDLVNAIAEKLRWKEMSDESHYAFTKGEDMVETKRLEKLIQMAKSSGVAFDERRANQLLEETRLREQKAEDEYQAQLAKEQAEEDKT